MKELMSTLSNFAHQDLVTRILMGVLICLCTYLIARICVTITRKAIRKDKSLLPDNTIFLNIIRICVYTIGFGVLLNVCFDIDLTAIFTALGVGGIVVSLGFQDTISNLIGGLEVSFSRLINPGDNVTVGKNGVQGIVKDVTWRHTTIVDYAGNTIVVPNSVMNNTALVKLLPRGFVTIPIVVNTSSKRLTVVAHDMEKAAKKAVGRVSKLKEDPYIQFSEIQEFGFKGSMYFTIADNSLAASAKDACIRAIAPYAHSNDIAGVANAINDVRTQEHNKVLIAAQQAGVDNDLLTDEKQKSAEGQPSENDPASPDDMDFYVEEAVRDILPLDEMDDDDADDDDSDGNAPIHHFGKPSPEESGEEAKAQKAVRKFSRKAS